MTSVRFDGRSGSSAGDDFAARATVFEERSSTLDARSAVRPAVFEGRSAVLEGRSTSMTRSDFGAAARETLSA
jgi:hypothetical protein